MPFTLRQIVSAALLCVVCTALIAAENFHYGRFGTVASYRPGDGDVRSVALLRSGDGGWDAGTVALAKRLAGLNTLVIDIDTRAYLQRLEGSAEACAHPWAELRSLAQARRKKRRRELPQRRLSPVPSLHPHPVGRVETRPGGLRHRRDNSRRPRAPLGATEGESLAGSASPLPAACSAIV